MLAYVSATESGKGEEDIFGSCLRIHFQGCNMRCVFCINKAISRPKYIEGALDYDGIVKKVRELGPRRSIHLITPSHIHLPDLKRLIEFLEPYGTIVYNTSGYDSPIDIMDLITGEYIDVFLVTFKFFANDVAAKYCGRSNYASVVKKNLLNISKHYQLEFKDNIIQRGLVVRHLLMPDDLGEAKKVCDFISSFENPCYFNLMDQYIPYKIPRRFPELSKKGPTYEQYMLTLNHALSKSLNIDKNDRRRKCLIREK